MAQLLTHLLKYFKWFLLVVLVLLLTELAFYLMNAASTIAFFFGCAILLFEIAIIVFIINHKNQTKQ